MRPNQNGRDLVPILAEFRYQLRTFLQFSEQAAHEVSLHPQQHQLLLQVAGTPERTVANIGYVAGRLGLRHHSTVELVNRSVSEGLLVRTADSQDRRRVALNITSKGKRILKMLSQAHARELCELGPLLVRSLKRIERADRTRIRRRSQ